LFQSILLAQPTANIYERTTIVESSHYRGTIFAIDVDQREYWITAKHILNGKTHPPYGSVDATTVQLKILDKATSTWLAVDFSVLDPGKDIDVVVLAPNHPLLTNPLPSPAGTSDGMTLGGTCKFLGFAYGRGWLMTLPDGKKLSCHT
jgi:hypothetical protein